jgi:hypothetical protein
MNCCFQLGIQKTCDSTVFIPLYWGPVALVCDILQLQSCRDIILSDLCLVHKKKNSMVWVRERTIPTERPPLVGEVIANFLRIEGATWSASRILRPYSRFSRQEPLRFYQVAPQLYSRGWVDPVPDPLLFSLIVPGIEPGLRPWEFFFYLLVQ